MNWVQFFQAQGKLTAELAQARADLKDLKAQLGAMAKDQHKFQEDTKVLVGSVRGGYKTIMWTAGIVGGLATLVARWWVIAHTGG